MRTSRDRAIRYRKAFLEISWTHSGTFVSIGDLFLHFREDPGNPQAICPSFDPSQAIIKEMLSQVAELHKGRISHVHIGSDEVFVIGQCSRYESRRELSEFYFRLKKTTPPQKNHLHFLCRCKTRMRVNKWTTDDLFLDHVSTVANFTKSLNLQPIMWDDMFRNIDVNVLMSQSLPKITEIMVWDYNTVGKSTADIIEKYSGVNFKGIWAASAFKGVKGPNEQMPQYSLHLNNNIDWLQVSSDLRSRVNLRGIALTGWQR